VLGLHFDPFNRALQEQDCAGLEAVYAERYISHSK